MTLAVEGLLNAQQAMKLRASNVRNLQPVMKRIGADIVKETDDAFQFSRSPAGEPFLPLKRSTILGRKSVRKRAGKRTKKGALTKGAQKFRAKLLAPGGSKPLVDTARARNSSFAEPGIRGVTWSAVGYLKYHIKGNARGRPPKRNPSVFEQTPTGWKVVPHLRQKYAEMIIWHIEGRKLATFRVRKR